MKTLNEMHLHTDALYQYDDSGQMIHINQFDGGQVPRFHLARTNKGNYSIFRHDVPHDLIISLQSLAMDKLLME